MLASQSQTHGRSCKPRRSTTRHTEAIDPVWHATDFVRAKGKATGRNSTTACSTAAASMPGHCMLKGSSMVHQLWLFSWQELCRLRTYLCELKRLLAKLSHRMKPPLICPRNMTLANQYHNSLASVSSRCNYHSLAASPRPVSTATQ